MTVLTFWSREQASQGDAISTALVALALLATTASVASACDAHAALGAPKLRMADAAQSAPTSDDTKPAESKPGGTRPTTPAPQPATPQDNAPESNAPPALPSAPAEKTGPPINAR